MEILEYLGVIRRHMLRIILLSVAAGAAAYFLTYALEEQYDAVALVLVTPSEKITLSASSDQKELLDYPVAGGGTSADAPAKTYIEIMRSRAVIERVVRDLGLDVPDEEESPTNPIVRFLRDNVIGVLKPLRQYLFYGRIIGEKTDLEKAIEEVQNNLELTAVKDTHLFEIIYSDTDPNLAAEIANAVAKLFLKYMSELQASSNRNALEHMEHKLRESEEELAQARKILREFKENHETISFDAEVTELIKLIGELESNLEETETTLAGQLSVYHPTKKSVRKMEAERSRLKNSLSQRRAAINALPDQERQLANLVLAVDSAEDIYKLIRTEYEESRIDQAKTSQEMRVVSYAVSSRFPARPIRFRYAIFTIFLTVWIGIGWAFVSEYLDTTLRSIDDVEKTLALPVLATVPTEKSRF